MPRELKKRGRRAEKQRQSGGGTDERAPKRQRTDSPDDFLVDGKAGDDFIRFGETADETVNPTDSAETGYSNTFYGLLTEDETAYYANVNAQITANNFENEAERDAFIAAVYRESSGKEMKIASSQSCSRYLEKIIFLSSAEQLKTLFVALLSDLNYLLQHRFGSHCVEALFKRSARFVQISTEESEDSMESLFLSAAQNIQQNIGFLMTERFASHVVRVLLLVLAGMRLEDEETKNMLASKKKEGIESQALVIIPETHKVPQSFSVALTSLINAAATSLDTTALRTLSTHPLGSPVLQLLVKIELTSGPKNNLQQATITNRLIPEQDFKADADTGKYVSSLVYDPIGAHLAEVLVRFLPGKLFKRMYKNLFADRIGKLAKNEISSYVAGTILERVGKDDLKTAMEAIIVELPGLIQRNRLAILRSLIDSCAKRSVDMTPLNAALLREYTSDNTTFLDKVMKGSTETTTVGKKATDAEKVEITRKMDIQSSLLAQSLLNAPKLCEIVQQGLLGCSAEQLEDMAKDPVTSHVLQAALASHQTEAKFLRSFLPKFYTTVSSLAVDASGSHVVDAIWCAALKTAAHFIIERLAASLAEHENTIRDSMYGRNVWRNWAMDLYRRKPAEWRGLAKDGNIVPVTDNNLAVQQKKTALQLARERYATRSRNVALAA